MLRRHRAREAVMAETKLVVQHREQLWSLLIEAAQFEHLIMCQYLYACFSLKTEPDEGLTAEQADAVASWQGTLTGIAIEEMLHLALVMNVMTAIGAGPSLSRPNFPRHSDFLPPGVEFALLPFGGDSLTHFLYLERPEGMERVDAAEFVPAVPPPDPVAGPEVMPRVQGFMTAGHLYRGIEQGLSDLAALLGEPVLFVGEPRAQATPDRFRYPQLIAVSVFPRLGDLGVLDRERVLASPGPSSRLGPAVASLPPAGRSSSLRSGRSTWACGFAGGRVAATGECPVLPRDSARPGRGAVGIPAVALGLMVVAGPGVACPKSWCAGCEPAALDAESFPGCPPGPVTDASAAWRASAWRRAKIASLIRRLRDRSASSCVFPSASFFS
jgi:hypothetical protein